MKETLSLEEFFEEEKWNYGRCPLSLELIPEGGIGRVVEDFLKLAAKNKIHPPIQANLHDFPKNYDGKSLCFILERVSFLSRDLYTHVRYVGTKNIMYLLTPELELIKLIE